MAARLHTRIFGSRSGPPLLLLHGLGGSWRVFRRLIPRLVSERTVVCIDLPGFGNSPDLGHGWTLDEAARCVDSALAHHGLDQVHLVGQSLGGAVALRLAMDNPGRFSTLSVVAPAGLAPTRAGRRDLPRSAHRAWRFVQRGAAPLLAGWPALRRRAFEHLVFDPDAIPAWHAVELAQWSGRARDTQHARAELRRTGLLAGLGGQLEVPLQIVWGVEDAVVPLGLAYRLHETVPASTLHLLPACGHLPSVEQPQLVAEILLDRHMPACAPSTEHVAGRAD